MMTKENLKGVVPESWLCGDCGVNTAPGMLRIKVWLLKGANKDQTILGRTTLRRKARAENQ